MAEKLTPQQEQAVKNRGGKLLVSAAAGSGKTKVLVDRLMGYLTDPIDPANIDDFLIITYTKAAASELRGKIASKLSEKIAEQPENQHLQRQLQRLYMTQISTVHAFCGELLRQFAWRLDLSGDFRVADENECAELRYQVMDQVLEEAYRNLNEDFCEFVDSQGIGRNDLLLPEVLLKVYDSARCHLDPEGWLQECLNAVESEDISDVSQTKWGRYLMDDLFAYLDLQIQAMEQCAERTAKLEGADKPAALLRDTVFQLRHLRDSQTWNEIVRRKDIDFGRLVFSKKCPDPELQEGVKAVRNACKKNLPKMTKNFCDSSEQIISDLKASAPVVRGMVAMVRAFGKAFEAAKEHRRILDFGDLEHRTLDLLLGRSRSAPTAIAREIGARFREVMVDEYQDSNAVQDAIYSALTQQRHNCFMVGDVKQSIYQFRLADPGIFLQKYAAFPTAEEARQGQGRKVLLSRNFRSGGAVLAAVNCVFENCMSPEVGGLHYGEDEALYEGIPHEPLGEPEVELHCVRVRDSAYSEEADYVTQRIRQLLDGSHMIRGKDGLRPVTPGDIVILLRSPGSVGEVFRAALEQSGIRCTTGGGTDLLRTEEIGVLRSLLRVVHNPQLDIPLTAALANPVFGFTADDLAAFRSENRKCSVYDALRNSDHPKAATFVSTLEELRRGAPLASLTHLMERIFRMTRIDSLYASMSDGEERVENLRTFYQMVVDYEAGGHKDLGRFLDHLDAMEEKGLIVSQDCAAGDAVTIMSIHKSKGLEFPVVFLCNLAREFNRESQSAQVLCHKELGIGVSLADKERRVRYPTVAKRAIASRMGSDSLSEELRVLYVAMTRAKDRLIMTYTSKNPEAELTEMVARRNMGQMSLLCKEVGCPGEWVLLSALGRAESHALFDLGGHCMDTRSYEYPWLVKVAEAPEPVVGIASADTDQDEFLLDEQLLRRRLTFRYGHQAATQTPSKMTATQQKPQAEDHRGAESTGKRRHWRKPSFAGAEVTGADRGNAIHKAMQYLRYEACADVQSVRNEVERLAREGYLRYEEAQLVDDEKIAAFFATPIGVALRSGNHVLREFKFSVLVEGENVDSALVGEKILLQGVVDCAIMEDDGIVVIDFKTDRVSEQTLAAVKERYRPQVEAYAQALSRIFEKPVKKSCLYLFALGRFVEY